MSSPPERPAGPYAWLPALVGLVALASVVIGYAGLTGLRDRLIASAGRTLALVAAESIDKLDLIIAEHARSLRAFAHDPTLATDDELKITTRLRAFIADRAEFRRVGVTDLSGRVMASSDPSHVGTIVGPSAWLAIARDVGLDVRAVRSSDAARTTFRLAFTMPLTDAQGAIRGALIAETSLAHVKRVFDRTANTLRRTWGVGAVVDWHLLSPNGDLIASTDRRPILGKLALPSAFASAAAMPGYLEERDPDRDVTMLTGYARMRGRSFPGSPRWAVLLHIHQDDVAGPVHDAIMRLAALWALVTAPLILLIVWATTRLRREWGDSRDESRRARTARCAADASEARMRTILDHAAEGIVTVDGAGMIASCNAAALRMFGLTAEQAQGSSVARLLPSGASGRHDRTVARWLTRSGGPGRARYREMLGRRRDGSVFPFGLALSRVTSGDQVVFVGIVRDLTDQRRAEADRGILASIIEHTEDFVGLAGLDGRVVFVNPAGRRLAGLATRGSLAHLALDDFVFPEDRARFHETVVPAVLRDGSWQGELRGRHLATGEALAVAVHLFLVRHTDTGRATGFAAVCRDLREQRRVGLETRRSHELMLAKEIAESASLAKSEFLATMSHEIRTPLNGVVGMTALLLDTRLTDEQREYAESLQTCSTALLGVIDDVLDFSRMEAGKLDLELIDFDLHRTVEEVVDLFAARAHGKGLELAASIDPATPSALRGDPNRLRQILTNLLSNALKFTSHGEVIVRVLPLTDGPSHARVQIAVTDTGIGIAPERQTMIFESFSQSDVSNARVYGGSGLGLAIVKRLTALMNGQIVVDSEPGVGSTFTLVLQLAKQPKALRPAPPAALAGRRVLVVDDSPTVRAVLRTYLRVLGMRCVCTEDGGHALALLRAAAARRRPFHAVLLDWEMPILDGVAVAQAISKEPEIAAVPIMLLTDLGQRRIARRAARRSGIVAYVSKPVRVDRLQASLLAILDGAPRARARPSSPRDARPLRRHPSGGRILVAEDDPASQRRRAVAREIWLPRRRRRRRPERRRGVPLPRLRPGADGRAVARARRLRRDRRDPPPRARRATYADRRPDRERGRRARTPQPRRGHGRASREADPSPGARGRAGPLGVEAAGSRDTARAGAERARCRRTPRARRRRSRVRERAPCRPAARRLAMARGAPRRDRTARRARGRGDRPCHPRRGKQSRRRECERGRRPPRDRGASRQARGCRPPGCGSRRRARPSAGRAPGAV